MDIIQLLLKEMEEEAKTTHKMLERIPDDRHDWRPHEKSMTIRQLATHIAELPSWTTMALKTEGLDFAKMDYTPAPVNSTRDLLELQEKSLASGKEHIFLTVKK